MPCRRQGRLPLENCWETRGRTLSKQTNSNSSNAIWECSRLQLDEEFCIRRFGVSADNQLISTSFEQERIILNSGEVLALKKSYMMIPYKVVGLISGKRVIIFITNVLSRHLEIGTRKTGIYWSMGSNFPFESLSLSTLLLSQQRIGFH